MASVMIREVIVTRVDDMGLVTVTTLQSTGADNYESSTWNNSDWEYDDSTFPDDWAARVLGAGATEWPD